MESDDELFRVKRECERFCEIDKIYWEQRDNIDGNYKKQCQEILNNVKKIIDKKFGQELPRLNAKLPDGYQIQEWEIGIWRGDAGLLPSVTITKVKNSVEEGDGEAFEDYVAGDLRTIEQKLGVKIRLPAYWYTK